jgi:propanol-preferring alcohol dehydrogenase
MKAAVMHSVKAPLVIEDVPVPKIGPREVLVETRTSGICGTDLHILEGQFTSPIASYPRQPAGVVAEMATRSVDFKSAIALCHIFFSCDHCYFAGLVVTSSARTEGDLGSWGVAEFLKCLPQIVSTSSGSPFRCGWVSCRCCGDGSSCEAANPGWDIRPGLRSGGVGQVLIQLWAPEESGWWP